MNLRKSIYIIVLLAVLAVIYVSLRITKQPINDNTYDKENHNEIIFSTHGYYTSRRRGERQIINYYPIENKDIAFQCFDRDDVQMTQDAGSNNVQAINMPEDNEAKIFDGIIKKLNDAHIVFNTPKTMDKEETTRIDLIMSDHSSILDISNKISGDNKINASIKISDKMEARLISSNKASFEITAITPIQQATSSIRDTKWTWNITALKSGKHSLYITLTAIISRDGKETLLSIKTFEKEIYVQVSYFGQVRSFIDINWKWLLGSLLFPLLAFYWKEKYSNKKDKSAK